MDLLRNVLSFFLLLILIYFLKQQVGTKGLFKINIVF